MGISTDVLDRVMLAPSVVQAWNVLSKQTVQMRRTEGLPLSLIGEEQAHTQPDGSLLLFAELGDGTRQEMRVAPTLWRWRPDLQ